MKNLIKWLSRSRFPYKPLITVEISRSRLLHNVSEFQKIAPCGRVIPALKSNAYGHGIYEIASILENERKTNFDFCDSIPLFAVDSYFEAISLRSKSIKTPLLVIGYTRPEDIIISNLSNISFFITSIHSLQEIQKTERHVKIHLKIDTGMNRQGILVSEIENAMNIIKSSSNIVLEGICSHLADADSPDPQFTQKQIDIWNNIVSRFEQSFSTIKYVHLSNSYGHKYTDKITANVSRLGIGLYGLIDDDISDFNLSPILQLKTIITGIKNISPGQSVGYNHSFTATRNMKIATIPVGYYEGLDKRLSNVGYVQVGKNKTICPIIGKISMNISTIDVTAVDDTSIGDEVIVISNNPKDKNSICSMAKLCNTIVYENVTKIPPHLKRITIK